MFFANFGLKEENLMKIVTIISLKALCLFVLLGAVQTVHASVITTPDGLNPGDQYRLVFVTAGLHNASSTDIETYNSFVTSQANAAAELASIVTTWKVLASTPDVDAMINTNTNPGEVGVMIYNLNGLVVASNNADLWDGNLTNPINADQFGNAVAGATFTGTGIDGIGIPDRELAANGFRVQYGNSGLTNSGWTTIDWSGSLSGLHFYAISDVIVVPEPATILLLSIGGIAMRRRNI